MVCGCPQHVQDRQEHPGIHIDCPNKGRRLEEAKDHIDLIRQTFQNDARQLDPTAVENRPSLLAETAEDG